MHTPRLALVPGEPAGVGPELCVRLAQQPRGDHTLVAFGDADSLHRAAEALRLPLRTCAPDAEDADAPGSLALVEHPSARPTQFGLPDPANAHAVIAALQDAASRCLAGACSGLVTGPVNKAVINNGGIEYSGTTELLARHAGRDVVMMLANPTMRVALATTHLPLREVPIALTRESLTKTLRILHASLRHDFGLADPVVAVLGLNPHAGEEGHLGREEIDVIEPVLDTLRAEGMRLVGPLPADTAFLPSRLAGFDALLAMYHDQGLPVLKYSGFEHAVNITLGLPYPRVAVDHGTALEIAGKGTADPSSLFAAVRTCSAMATARTGAMSR
ncbi:MAG: 4-hydroxythreonine-4-phosphate dehydrogenase PdxA [Lysobacter spongiicola]|nr:4-hydroxythreonine-4-phosphate dehydrogenase PdxA [Lysobacter spongiicola]